MSGKDIMMGSALSKYHNFPSALLFAAWMIWVTVFEMQLSSALFEGPTGGYRLVSTSGDSKRRHHYYSNEKAGW